MSSWETFYPFLILLIGIAFVVVTIVILRVHAFLALIVAAVLLGVLSPHPLVENSESPLAVQAVNTAIGDLGDFVGKIGVVIALASIIGKCLMDSGAADMITRRLLAFFGVKRAPLALLGSGYVLSIPVFFDTVFYLLVPLAKAFRLRTGRDYVFYVMAIGAGGAATHSLVAPTPGPLMMADNLEIDLGVTIVVGLLYSFPPAIIGGWFYARWVSNRLDIPLRDSTGFSTAELEQIINREDSELPPLSLSLLPIALPVLLIASHTVVSTIGASRTVLGIFEFLGDKNFALFASALVAMYLLVRQKRLTLEDLRHALEPALASGGIIILITAAGGAFGKMINHVGVGEAIKTQVPQDVSGTVLILLAFGIAAIMKIAQGSGTVSLITTSAMMFSVIQGQDLPFHPVYIFLAIGFGSMFISWMNDSGFWVVSQMSGFTERETLKIWTPLLAIIAIVGLIEILVLSFVLPLSSLP